MLTLKNFTADNDIRPYLRQTLRYRGNLIATNGYILLAVPETQCLEPISDFNTHNVGHDAMAKTMDRLFMQINAAEFNPMPQIHLPETKTCPCCCGSGKATWEKCRECDGEGDVCFDNDFNSYTSECKTCDGDGGITTPGGDDSCDTCQGLGNIYAHGSVSVDGLSVQTKYIALLLDEPEIEISIDRDKHALLFRAGEKFGCIMGMRE